MNKNPSSLVFWNDLENDGELKTCSWAAKGLWACKLLPIAARSREYGVVIIGDHPCIWDRDLPVVLAKMAGGGDPEIVKVVAANFLAMLTELVTSKTASVDAAGRLVNRRMVRESEERQHISEVRSRAGKQGADAKKARKQTSSKQEANSGSNDQANGEFGTSEVSDGNGSINPTEAVDFSKQTEANDGKQNLAFFMLQDSNASIPFVETSSVKGTEPTSNSTSTGAAGAPPTSPGNRQPDLLEEDLDPPLRIDRSWEAKAVGLWNETAERVNRELGRTEWPLVQKIGHRRKAIRARLNELGGTNAQGLEGWKLALDKASRSRWLRGELPRSPGHEDWRFNLDTLVREKFFTNLMERPEDDAPSRHQGSAAGNDTVLAGAREARARRHGVAGSS